jgi:hypothetical protein
MPVRAESIGLWLIAIGSPLVIAATVAVTPDMTKGHRFATKETTRRERLVFAAQVSGLAAVTAGSLLVAFSQKLALWVLLGTLVAICVCGHVLSAWLLKRYWHEKQKVALAVASTGGDLGNTDAAQHQAAIARRCATWRWCLLHPLNTEAWPGMESRE